MQWMPMLWTFMSSLKSLVCCLQRSRPNLFNNKTDVPSARRKHWDASPRFSLHLCIPSTQLTKLIILFWIKARFISVPSLALQELLMFWDDLEVYINTHRSFSTRHTEQRVSRSVKHRIAQQRSYLSFQL